MGVLFLLKMVQIWYLKLSACAIALFLCVHKVYSRRDQSVNAGLYNAICEINSFQLAFPLVETCVVALFHSHQSFRIVNVPLDIGALEDYCDELAPSTSDVDQKIVVMAIRGRCPFDTKVRNVENGIAFAEGVVIVDPNAVNLAESPLSAPGSADPAYQSRIPCVLMGSHLYEVARTLQEYNKHFDRNVLQLANVSWRDNMPAEQKMELNISIAFSKPDQQFQPPLTTLAVHSKKTESEVVACGFMLSGAHQEILRSFGRTMAISIAGVLGLLLIGSWCCCCTYSSSYLYFIVLTAVILVVALLLRCGTFRLASPEGLKNLALHIRMRPDSVVPGKLLAPYAHSETDELVYEVLVQSILQSIFDYSLWNKIDLLHALNLSFSHYNMRIFIHPPNFVYFCAFCSHFLGLHLISIPLLCQGVTLLCVGAVASFAVSAGGGYDCAHSMSVGTDSCNSVQSRMQHCVLWSMLLYAFCPLSVFISQKLWIDNMLCMTVSAAVGLHVYWSLGSFATVQSKTANGLGRNDAQLFRQVDQWRSEVGTTGSKPSSWEIARCVLRCIYLLNRHQQPTSFSMPVLWTAFGSSLCFSLLACNTKITALAVLPCMGLFSSLLLTRCVLTVLFDQLHRPLPGAVVEKQSGSSSSDKKGAIRVITTRAQVKTRAGVENNVAYASTTAVSVIADHVSIGRIVVLTLLICTGVMALVFLAGFLVGHGPWMLLYKSRTGRWMPNAWPSGEMLKNSPYMLKVVRRPWFYYLKLLCEAAPAHLMGMSYGVWRCAQWIRSLTQLLVQCAAVAGADSTVVTSAEDRMNRILVLFSPDDCVVILLTLWCLAVLVGNNVLGVMGAGYQTRFIAPLATPCCILTALLMVTPVITTTEESVVPVAVPGNGNRKKMNDERTVAKPPSVVLVVVRQSSVIIPMTLLFMYTAMITLFYGVLYAPLFADFDLSIWDILFNVILAGPKHDLSSAESMREVTKFMKHYGLKIN